MRLNSSMSLASAGTLSPAWMRMMSPGTSSLAKMRLSLPSRMTRASRAAIFLSASNALSARYSWRKPRKAEMMTMAMMAAASRTSPMRRETKVAPRRRMMRKSLN